MSSMNGAEPPARRRVAVWDLPTRLFHWLLVALFVALWITGTNDMFDWHMWIGRVVLMLIVFRVAWGLVGSRHSRFSDFVVGPKAGVVHLREILRIAVRGAAGGDGTHRTGHTRLGGWMILVMLALLLAQTLSGLFATDDITVYGPLNHLVSSRTARILSVYHSIAFNVILALVVIHIAAAFFYLIRKRENLIWPLITGRTMVPTEATAREDKFASPWLALALLIAAALIVWGTTSL